MKITAVHHSVMVIIIVGVIIKLTMGYPPADPSASKGEQSLSQKAVDKSADQNKRDSAAAGEIVAKALTAHFNPVSDFGLTQIEVDDQNLLVGNGFHIIGGLQPNHDVQSNQINSQHPSTKTERCSWATTRTGWPFRLASTSRRLSTTHAA